jgi:hypothetical protein
MKPPEFDTVRVRNQETPKVRGCSSRWTMRCGCVVESWSDPDERGVSRDVTVEHCRQHQPERAR